MPTEVHRMESKVCNKEDFVLNQSPNEIYTEVTVDDPDSTSYTPPDGGWGWVVVAASFMCNFIVDGIIFSFGILLLEISADFRESKGVTASIGSLQAGFYLVVGPLVSALSNCYGCRAVTICGSVITSIGFIASFYATSVFWLSMTFGVLGGIGFGFIYLPAIVTVGHYFDRRRAFATGIAVCGSGIGAFLTAPMVQMLIAEYGWRGCILILAGVVLNCAVFGSLFRPAEEYDTRAVKQTKEEPPTVWVTYHDQATSTTASQDLAPPTYSEVTTDLLIEQTLAAWQERTSKFFVETVSCSKEKQHIIENGICTPLDDIKEKSPSSNSSSSRLPTSRDSESQMSGSRTSTVMQMFDMTLLSSPSFMLLASSGFLTLAGFFIPFMYIVDRAMLLGIPAERGALILSTIGVTNTVGRVFCGWISDRPKVNALLINNVALVIGGMATFLTPVLFNTYASLLVFGSIFGFAIACFAALRSVITVELLGLQKLTSAFGLLLLPQGIATIIGSPLAGWFYDITGSYDASFYLAGALISISGIMCFPLPYIARWEKKDAESASQLTCRS